jgi:hypothetical protein
MYKIVIALCLCLSLSFTSSSNALQKQAPKPLVFVLSIDDFFKNDELSLTLNKVTILDKEVVSSNVVGNTGLNFNFYTLSPNKLFVQYGGKELYISHAYKLNMVLMLNGKKRSIIIDLKKGKYIGLSKKDINDFFITQSKTPFIYD